MQHQPVPRERQHLAVVVRVGERVRVEGRVQQRRVHAELAGFLPLLLRQDGFREDLVTAPPHRPQALERRTVRVAALEQVGVEGPDLDRLGARGRPRGEVVFLSRSPFHRRRRRRRQEPSGVPRPFVRAAVAGGVLALRVHVHRARAGFARSADRDLQPHAALLGEHQR